MKRYDELVEALADLWGVIVLLILAVIAFFIFNHYWPVHLPVLVLIVGTILWRFLPWWLAPVLLAVFVKAWLAYARASFVRDQPTVLLEIKLPREITKSPAAMELVFTALYQTGSASYLETYWLGKVRPWFSCELASFGGEVKFFIWTTVKFRGIVEAQIYAQYPNVEIFEVPDYTHQFVYDPAKYFAWGTYWKLTAADVYPIKTYIDYGLDKDPKEEFKIDPLTSVLEYLGALKRGEQAWIQILFQAHKKESWQEGRLFTKPDWKDEARAEIELIRAKATPPPRVGKEGQQFPGFPNPTKGQVEKISSLERSINKFPFETAIRGFYLAEWPSFNSSNISGLIASVFQYSSPDLNGFKLGWYTDHADLGKDIARVFGWFGPLKRYMDRRIDRFRIQLLEAYKLRSFFQPPYQHFHRQPFILNTEELATIFHFPGQIATTPSLAKIESKRGEPPPNLPI